MNTLWGLLRRRSSYNISINEYIENIKLLEATRTIYIITKSKFYSGKLVDDNIVLEKTSLLIYKKDPFTPSPKRVYSINKSKSIPIRPHRQSKTECLKNNELQDNFNITSNSI